MQTRTLAALMFLAACRTAAPSPSPPRDQVLLVRDSTRVGPPVLGREEPETPAPTADSLIREATARRAAWQARGIRNYGILVAVGCFCPWPSNPAILEVRDGVVVALRDTTGRSMGKPREPWSIYTVEGLFDAVVEHARRGDAIAVRFDPQYGYPNSIRGSGRVGPDTWYWVSAGRLTLR